MSPGATGSSSLRFSALRFGVFRALVRRDYSLSRSYRFALVLDAFFGGLNLLVYFFISKTFENAATAELAGAPSYFAFAVVGVTLSLLVQVASTRVAYRVRDEQLTGTLEALVAQPISSLELCLGLSGFQLLFGLTRATVYLLTAIFLADIDVSRADWGGFTLMILATGAALLPFGIVAAAAVLVLQRAELLIGMTTLVLGLVGGAFFPVSALPGWLEPVAEVLPTRFAFDGARAALFLGEDWAGDCVKLALFGAVALPLAVVAFDRALVFAKRRGSLATY